MGTCRCSNNVKAILFSGDVIMKRNARYEIPRAKLQIFKTYRRNL